MHRAKLLTVTKGTDRVSFSVQTALTTAPVVTTYSLCVRGKAGRSLMNTGYKATVARQTVAIYEVSHVE